MESISEKTAIKRVPSCSANFDDDLRRIEALLRLPWVGNSYSELPGKKMLIVGESHYNHTSIVEKEVKSFETRWMIHSLAYWFKPEDKEKRHKFLRTTEEVMFCKKQVAPDKRKHLWNSVCFYNLVQRKMASKNHRPTKDDFKEGWLTFFKVVEVLEPDFVIFCGTSALSFLDANKASLQALGGVSRLETIKSSNEKVNGTKMKDVFSLSLNGKTTMIMSFKHPSVACSYWKWGKILKEQLPEYFNWLRSTK